MRAIAAGELAPCECCGEPWCPECKAHYAECAHPGPHSEPEAAELRVVVPMGFSGVVIAETPTWLRVRFDSGCEAVIARDDVIVADCEHIEGGKP
jgi:hypothetical protein